MHRPILLLLFVSTSSLAQMITSAQQKALNSFVDYANQSADETAAVVKSIIDYYPRIHQKNSFGAPRYNCPVQLEDYYYNTALASTKGMSAAMSNALTSRIKELRTAAERIDEKCKALDTYHKLEDYKQDNFAKAELWIAELQLLVAEYKKSQYALNQELESSFKKLNAGAKAGAYHKADEMMRAEVARERTVLDLWNFNVKEELHTGWPVEKFEQGILETDNHLAALRNFKAVLQYPASSMWSSFQGSLASVLSTKRSGLDEYNYEAKKSDKHSNDVYMGLINYFNGTLVSDYNTFIQFSERDGYYGLKSIKYFPLFEIRTQTKMTEISVKPYKDIPHTPVPATPQRISLSKPHYEVLSNYIDYINETYRQTRYMQMVLRSFNSTASYYKTLESFERRGAMSFDYKDFQLPLSQYQKTIADSKSLPPPIAKSLNEQTEVIMNILKEMNDLGAMLELEAREKRYERDHLKKVYEILERQKVLLEAWDDKKEILYQDVRKVFDSYPIAQAAGSWYLSGKALLGLTDLDHEGLFAAKAFYKGRSAGPVATERIDEALRNVIANEYNNMKGIEKLGRYNGLCPYTPYEDLPVTSKSLSEELKKLKPPTSSSSRHPYETMVYHYNDIVDDYNKFCELSHEVLHLKTVKQPELFDVQYPKQKENATEAAVKPAVVAEATHLPETKTTSVQQDPGKDNSPMQREASVQHDTKVKHDTIYIERRDTVYITEPGENLRSMEGYAINNMVLLLDVSGSMNSPEKLPLLKSSVLDLLSMMRLEDEVSIISFSEKPKALLTATSFKEEAKIKRAINDLKSSGKTDGNAGLKLAYKVADENYIRGGNNRIILATDGEFALSDETKQLIEKFSREDIYLTIFNFGKGAGASKALERLAQLGKGNYEHISKDNVELQLIREVKAKKKK